MTSHTGDWFYTHQDLQLLHEILQNGWRPELNTGSKYGCGVYLARGWWHDDAAGALKCRLHVEDAEVASTFDAQPGFESEGSGRTYKHLRRYLKAQELVKGVPATQSGGHPDNVRIRDHFLKLGKKVVMFDEHDHEVCVVFDPSCIEIVEFMDKPLVAEDHDE